MLIVEIADTDIIGPVFDREDIKETKSFQRSQE